MVVALALAAGCVDLTRPWEVAHGPDAPRDVAAGVGGQLGRLDGAEDQRGAGGAIVPVDLEPAGGSGGGPGDADTTSWDAPVGTGGSNAMDAVVDTGGAIYDAQADAPIGTGGVVDAAIDVGGAGGGGGATARGGSGGGSGTGGAGGTGSGGKGTGGSGSGGKGTGGSGSGGKGTGGSGTGGSATGGTVGSGGTTSTGGNACSGYVGRDAGTDGGLASGLVAYYPCETAAGSSLPDQSGNNNHATLATGTGGSSGYSFAAGKKGNALFFAQASKGYAAVPAGVLASACEMTVATWVFLNTNSNWQRIWDFGKDQNAYMFMATTNNVTGKLRFAITVNGNGSAYEQPLDGAAALPTKVWTHVAMVLGPTGALLYVDGAQVAASAAITLRPADLGSTPNNYLGRSQWSADPYLDGAIDEFRIYDRALAPDEIAALASGS